MKEQAQALGWSKATKLEGRSTSQGLVGVLVQKNLATIIEVNCETDFVARNENFQKFVEKASQACSQYISTVDNTEKITKIGLENETLRNLSTDDGKTLADHLALMIGTVGENASLKRAICYKTPDSVRLCGYAHPAPESFEDGKLLVGKYGAIAAFNSNSEKTEEILKVHRKICQHIVGMKPEKIGNAETDKPNEVKEDEKCLIHQEFLLDPEVTIGDILQENNIKIIDFQRFECGEKVESYQEAASATANSKA